MKKSFKKTLILNLGITLGLIFLFLGGTFALKARMASNTGEIERLKAEQEIATFSIQSFAALKNASAQAVLYEEKLNVLLPSQEELINFAGIFRELASRHNVALGFIFGKENPSDGSGPANTEFQMSLEGSSFNTIAFLEALYKEPYFIAIEKIDIVQTETAYQTRMQGRIFSQ